MTDYNHVRSRETAVVMSEECRKVRIVKSMDLLVVEHALRAVLRDHEASFWLYEAARDYTGRTDELIPESAPMVEDIAGFWRKHLGIKR
jgi:hypothetical protein